MVRTEAKVCDFGWKAVDFDLPGVDGARRTLASSRGPNGLLVMFICNHCPYVKAVLDRIVRDCKDAVPNARRELFEAMVAIARTGQGPQEQIPSIGCSIKWKG